VCPTVKEGTSDETCVVTTNLDTMSLARRNVLQLSSMFSSRSACRSPYIKLASSSSYSAPTSASAITRFLKSNTFNATHRDVRFSPHSRSVRPPPRPQKKHGWLDSQPQSYVFCGIMVINGVVFLAWQWAASERVGPGFFTSSMLTIIHSDTAIQEP
jgi:hypothetical protein